MDNTVRQRILSSVCTDLLNITEANGYNTTIGNVIKGFVDGSAITNFPTACVYFGTSVLEKEIEGYAYGVDQLDLVVLVYLNNPVDKQTDETEKLIADIYRFFNKDENLNPLFVSHLQDLEYVQGYNIVETNPYLAGKNNLSCAGFLIKIQYVNFVDSVPAPVPEVPTLLTPVDEYADGVVRQAFDWADATDASYYRIQVSEDSFNTVVIDQSYLTESSYTIPEDVALSDGTTYYWRVKSLGTVNESGWSGDWEFTVNEVLIPGIPVLVSPSDGAYNQAMINYVWQPSARATSYDLQVATNSGFSTLSLDKTGLVSTAYADTTGGNDGTTYFWKVRGVNGVGNSNWSSARSVIVNEDFNPSHLLPKINLWCKSTEGYTLVGSKVSKWDDLSGKGNHLIQNTDADRPTKQGTPGSYPDFYHNVANINLQIPTAVFSGLTECEMFAFFYPAGASNGCWDLGSSADTSHIVYATLIYDEAFTTVRKNCGTPVVGLNNWWIYNVVSKAGEWTNRINGTQQYTTGTNTVGFSSTPRIGWSGGVYGLNGYWREIIILNKVLTTTERANFLAYFKKKYSIA